MICLAIGLSILGFAALRHGGCCYATGHGGFARWRRWRGFARRHHHRRYVVTSLLDRIDASPAQERAILREIDQLEQRVYTARRSLRDVGPDLAAALRGPALDDAALGAVLGRVDATTTEIRTAALDALRAVHGLLDDDQRARVAELLERGIHRGGDHAWRRGPYR